MQRFETEQLGRIRRRGDGVRDCRVLVACSGGGDSTALLAFLCAVRSSLGLDLVVAHADHGLRDAAEDEAAFVSSLCRCQDLDLVQARLDVQGHARATGQGLEMAARELRWAWLRAEAQSCRAPWIATGHTLDDHTETVFLRLARGGGLGSITPLPPTQGDRWSPLVEARRDQLRAYLGAKGLRWREDASNQEPFTPRNRIRKLLQEWRAEAPGLDQHLWETHLQARELELWREAQVRSWSPARWELQADGLRLAGPFSPLELRWVLERTIPALGRAVDATLLRALGDWIAPRLLRKRPRPLENGGWLLEPAPGGWLLRLPANEAGSEPRR